MKKPAVALTLVAGLLFSVLAGSQLVNFSAANFFPDPGPDLPRIYIRANGNVEPATAPIEKAGNIYRFTSNIALQTIVIQRDNIVLDGSNYLIEGNKSWMGLAPRWGDSGNNGVIISAQNNINITNLNIEKFTAGVRITGSSHINIVSNSFKEETSVFETPSGIIIEASSQVLIENNNFTNINGPAIVCNGTNVTIRGNSLSGIVDAIDGSIAIAGSSNTIIDNKIDTISPSIRLGLADSNIIARNHVTGGLSIVSGSNNLVFANNLTSIRIFVGSNNTFFGNNIADDKPSLELDQWTVNNTFYANTFPANCSIRNNDAGTTFWDNGTIGNYWADYNGTDRNGDGIGDSPFILTAVKWDNEARGDVGFVDGQDNYPLMKPYDVESNTLVLSQAESFPIAIVVFVVVAVVALGLFVFKKRKH